MAKDKNQMMLPLDKLLTPAEKKPATTLMKTVAAKAPNNLKNMKKVFTAEERAEIARKSPVVANEYGEDKVLKREQYRGIKRYVREMEIGNQDRVIIFPSLTNGDGWYKTMEFSALYYAYRLAPRLGRKARVMKDSDRFLKAQFVVSLTNVEKLIEQIQKLEEDVKVEKTEQGIYILTLPRPVSDDECAALRRTEATRRDRMHNILRPKDMEPATFNALLAVVRQLLPRIKKMEKSYYDMLGDTMAKDLHKIMTNYGLMTDGVIERSEAGLKIMENVDSLTAGLILLAEVRIWPYETVALIGENMNCLKKMVEKDFIAKKGENG